MLFPLPKELTREVVDELRGRVEAGTQPAAYVLRHGAPTWVTITADGDVGNVQAELVEPDPGGGWRVASL